MPSLIATAHPIPDSPVESNRTPTNSPTSHFHESGDDSSRWSLATYVALLMLIVLWAVKVYSTWAAWGNLTIDSGREMYIPALLAQGKVLYRDVWFPYGPAGPYFNSYLFRLFGVKLNVLYWAGSLSALGSAILLYLAGMRLSAWRVGWTAGAILLLQAFAPSLFSFPLPYSYSTVYGCLLGCLFLWIAIVAVSATLAMRLSSHSSPCADFHNGHGDASRQMYWQFCRVSWHAVLCSYGWCPLKASSSLPKKISWAGQLRTS